MKKFKTFLGCLAAIAICVLIGYFVGRYLGKNAYPLPVLSDVASSQAASPAEGDTAASQAASQAA